MAHPAYIREKARELRVERRLSIVEIRLKGPTSRVLRSEFPEPLMRMPSLWTRSFFVSTAGNVSGPTIEKYIARQRTRE
jgi:REP element-mobilizing transposase RayT